MEFGAETDEMSTLSVDIFVVQADGTRSGPYSQDITLWMTFGDIKDEILMDPGIVTATQGSPHWAIFMTLEDEPNNEPQRLHGLSRLEVDQVRLLLASEAFLELRPADPLPEELQRVTLNNQPFNVSIADPQNRQVIGPWIKNLNVTLPATDAIDAILQDAKTPMRLRTAMGQWELHMLRGETDKHIPTMDFLNSHIPNTTEMPDAVLQISQAASDVASASPVPSDKTDSVYGLQFK